MWFFYAFHYSNEKYIKKEQFDDCHTAPKLVCFIEDYSTSVVLSLTDKRTTTGKWSDENLPSMR